MFLPHPGIEPRSPDYMSSMLPLHQGGILSAVHYIRRSGNNNLIFKTYSIHAFPVSYMYILLTYTHTKKACIVKIQQGKKSAKNVPSSSVLISIPSRLRRLQRPSGGRRSHNSRRGCLRGQHKCSTTYTAAMLPRHSQSVSH